MATKHHDHYGEFDFDTDLDFDFEPEPRHRAKSDSKLDQFKEGLTSTLRTKFTDPGHYRSMLRDSLPEGASTVMETVETLGEEVGIMYDDAIKHVRPQLSSVTRKLERLVPDAATRSKRFIKTISEKLSDEMPDHYDSYQKNAEDAGVERLMAQFDLEKFNIDQDEKQRADAKELVNQEIDLKRFGVQHSLLSSIAKSTQSTRQYMLSFDSAYKRKSLELQFRSYGALATLVKATADQAEQTKLFQEILVRNTGLPDYAKTIDETTWKSISKGQDFSENEKGLFGSKSRLAAARERMSRAGAERIQSIKDRLTDADFFLDQILDAKEVAEQQAELTGKKYSGSNTAGLFAGEVIGNGITDFVSQKIKDVLSKNPEFMKKAYTAGRFALNPNSLFDNIRKSDIFTKMQMSDNPLVEGMASMLETGMGFFRKPEADMTIKDVSIGSAGENKILTQIRVNRSVVDIIPGYLARILREITVLRTGDDKTGLLTYDPETQSFKTEKAMSDDLLASLKRKAAEARTGARGETYSEVQNKLYSRFVGKEVIEDDKVQDIQKFLTQMSRSSEDVDYTAEGIRKSKQYQELTDSVRETVDRVLDARFKGDTHETAGRSFRMTKVSDEARNATGNLMGDLQTALRNGQNELLAEKGLIKRNKDGDWVVDKDAYYKLFDDTITKPTTVASDITLKTNIRPTQMSGSKAVDAFKKTVNYTWNYKDNSGYQPNPPPQYGSTTYTGPMAQDVQKNFGDETAPNGTKIDLVSMNGHMVEAMKKIIDTVDAMKAGDTVKYLRSIGENTKQMAQNLGEKAGLTPESISGAVGKGKDMFSRAIEALNISQGSNASKAVQAGSAAAIAAKEFWSNRDQSFKDARTKITEMSVNAAKKAAEFGTNVLFGKAPIDERLKAGAENLRSMAGKAKDRIEELRAGLLTPNSTESGSSDQTATPPRTGTFPGINQRASEMARRASRTINSTVAGATGLDVGSWIDKAKQAKDKVTSVLGEKLNKPPGDDFVGPRAPSERSPIVDSLKNRLAESKIGQKATALFDKASETKVGGKLIGAGSKILGSTVVGKAGKLASGIFGAIGSVASALTSSGGTGSGTERQTESDTNQYDSGDHQSRLNELNRSEKADSYRQSGGRFNDRNNDGQRDAGTADRMREALNAQQANEERKNANREAAERSAAEKASALKSDNSAITGLIDLAVKGLTGIAGIAGNILSTATSFFGLARTGLGAAASIGKGVLGVGKTVFNGARAGVGILSGIGSGVTGILSKVPGAARVGQMALSATRIAATVGLATGGATGMLGSVLGLAGGLLSSPLFIGAAVVGGTAFAAYKAYRYFTKNNLDDFQRIRAMQYGLSGSDDTKEHNSKLMNLEGYILDGNLEFRNGVASINSRSVKNEEMLEIMEIPPDNESLVEKFAIWLNRRFAPVLLKHVNALYRADNKASLNSVSDLDPLKLSEYLSGIDISDVWNVTASPFIGLSELGTDPLPSRELIAIKVKELGKKAKDDKNKSSPANTKKLPDSVVSSLPNVERDTDKVKPVSTILPDQPRTPLPENSQAARLFKNNPYLKDIKPSATSPAAPVSMDTIIRSGSATSAADWSDGSAGLQNLKLGKDAKIDGMHPSFMKAVFAMAQEYMDLTGRQLPVNEAFRDYNRQAELYAQYPEKAAKPGSSMHEYGLAMDIPSVVMKQLEEFGLLKKYGFTRPVRGETWHMEPSGVQMALQKSKQDPALAAQLIESSPGRGGGGIGATSSSIKGGRDLATAKAVFGADKVDEIMAGTKPKGATVLPSSETDADTGKLANGPATDTGRVGQAGVKVAENAKTKSYSTAGKDQSVTFSPSPVVTGSIGDGSGTHDKVKAEIIKASMEAGQDPNKMLMMAAMESSLDPRAMAKDTSGTGLHQFIDSTWKEQVDKHGSKYKLGPNADRTDPRASTLMASEYMKTVANRLRKAKGGELEMVDEYMGHMFGAGGASLLLRAGDDAIAAQLMPRQAGKNVETFYENGVPRTVGQLKMFLDNKLRKKAKEFGIQLPASSLKRVDQNATEASSDNPSVTVAANAPNPELAKPKNVTGYGLPSTEIGPVYRPKNTSISAPNASFDPTTAPVRAPMMRTTKIDPATVASLDIFQRLSSSSEDHTKHLSSIDTGINSKVVPLLEKIATAVTTNPVSSGGSTPPSQKKDELSTASAAPSNSTVSGPAQTRPQRSSATASSFDNRLALTG